MADITSYGALSRHITEYLTTDKRVKYYKCKTLQNPNYCFNGTLYVPVDATYKADTVTSAGSISLASKGIVSVGIKNADDQYKFIGLRPDEKQDGTEQFEICPELLELNGKSQTIDLSTRTAISSITTKYGSNLYVQRARQRLRIMMLADDPGCTLIEPIGEKKEQLRKVYEGDLMLNGGHIAGWAVEDPALLAQIDSALNALGSQEAFDARYPQAKGGAPLTLAVGDGNHSLASAKACWEELKKTLTPEQQLTHPARWCLAEVCNVHSPAIEIEPIHRVLFNVDCGAVLLALIAWSDSHAAGICFGDAKQQSFTLAGPHVANVLSFEHPVAPLTVGTIDAFIEYFMARHIEARVDYVHDEPAVRALCRQGGVAFLMPPFEKSDLFKGIVMGGVLPRKTFSMGHAEEKRYYMECRNILGEE